MSIRRGGDRRSFETRRTTMVGFITERDLEEAEEAFPGILGFFRSLSRKPRTFLDLVSLFQRWGQSGAELRRAA
jgi:hypothetical protein